VEICNAGHCPPLLIKGDEIAGLEATGLPLGIFNVSEYSTKNMMLAPGDSLLLYTDGLTEAQDEANAEYGPQRLAGLVKGRHNISPQALTEVCLEDLKTFLSGVPKTDDLSIMVIRRVS
jgi:sigma-B regulation protein RsbU (phosphoserine phosphatase)